MVVYGFEDKIVVRAVLGSLCGRLGGGVAHPDDLSMCRPTGCPRPARRGQDRQLDLTVSLADWVADPGDPAKITRDLRTLPARRIFGIPRGYTAGD